MSRYQIPTIHRTHEAFVGWDAPMTTFFAQVFDRNVKDRDEQLLLWMGDDDLAIPTLQHLQDAVADYATIPTNILTQLEADHDQAWAASPLQQQMRKFREGMK
jgi:hypothetical protein